MNLTCAGVNGSSYLCVNPMLFGKLMLRCLARSSVFSVGVYGRYWPTTITRAGRFGVLGCTFKLRRLILFFEANLGEIGMVRFFALDAANEASSFSARERLFVERPF